MPRCRPIPFTVIGGFLGAGKTTLLNRLLAQTGGVRYVVLVNDFGSLNIDAALIQEQGGQTLTLANGCICCSIGDRLIETLIDLLARPDPGDHILVEASGVGDPRRIADIAVIDRDLAPDGIVVLVDAAEVRRQADDRHIGDTVRRQLAAADIVVVNKVDLATTEELAALDRWLAAMAPGAGRLFAQGADVAPALLLGRGSGAARGGGAPLPEAHDQRFRHSLLLRDRPLDREAFLAAVATLPAAVIRGKGIARFADAPACPELFQMVGRRWHLSPAPLGAAPPDGCSVVFIGTAEMPDLQLRFPIA